MNEGTHWGQGYNQPTKGCSAEEGPIKRPLNKWASNNNNNNNNNNKTIDENEETEES
jgi:hypothetical protein